MLLGYSFSYKLFAFHSRSHTSLLLLLSESHLSTPLLNFFQMSSPSSLASSLYSIFDHPNSRSASPSSVGSSYHSLSDIPTSYHPKTCVYIPTIRPETLKAVFNRYAQGGFLGLYLPARKPQSASIFINWDKHDVSTGGKTQVEVFISTSTEHSVHDLESQGVSLRPVSIVLLSVVYHYLC